MRTKQAIAAFAAVYLSILSCEISHTASTSLSFTNSFLFQFSLARSVRDVELLVEVEKRYLSILSCEISGDVGGQVPEDAGPFQFSLARSGGKVV